MKCPNCRTSILSLSKICNSCNYTFDDNTYAKLCVYFNLKKDVHYLGLIKDNFVAGIEKVNQQLQKYEELVNKDLQNIKIDEKYIEKEKNVMPPGVKRESEYESITVKDEKTIDSKNAETLQKKTVDFESRLGQKWLLIISSTILTTSLISETS